MIALTYLFHFVALLLAGAVAMRDKAPRQRSIARAIALLLALAVIRRACLPDDIAERLATYQAGGHPPPYEGAQRVVWAVGQVVSRGWYFVVTWAVWRALKSEGPEAGTPSPSAPPTDPKTRRTAPLRGILLAIAALATFAFYFFAYLSIRGATASRIAVGVYLLTLAAQLAIGTAASLRGYWPTRNERASWLTAWILICSSLAGLAGPWALAHPRRDWYIAPWIATATWIAIGGVHAWILMFRRTESPSA